MKPSQQALPEGPQSVAGHLLQVAPVEMLSLIGTSAGDIFFNRGTIGTVVHIEENISTHLTRERVSKRPSATSVCGLKLRMYEALRY